MSNTYYSIDRVQPHGQGGGPVATRYQQFAHSRTAVEEWGREASRLTIPGLLPESGTNDQTDLHIAEQSLGAQGVSTLSGGMTISFIPPGTGGVFTLEPVITSGQKMDDKKRAALNSVEAQIHQKLSASGIRAGFHTAVQHLLVTGNACVYIAKDYTLRVYRIDQYVVNRQPDGTIMEVIVHDRVDIQTLPEQTVKRIKGWEDKVKSDNPEKRLVSLYTHTLRTHLYNKSYGIEHSIELDKADGKGDWTVVQEVEGVMITTTPKRYKKLPFIPIRYSNNAGENWGRSLVYEMRGDLRTYDDLSRAIREAAAASSRVVFLSNPAGMTDEYEVNNAENGDTVPGRVEDVQPLVADLRANLDVAQRYLAQLENRLSQQFLMVGGYKRDAERVTAYEKQMDAAELERALGGAYTYISVEFLQPLMESFIEKMVKEGILPKTTLEATKVELLTGYAALGRQQNLQRLRQLIADLTPIADQAFSMLDMSALLHRFIKESGVNPDGLVKSEEEAQNQQAGAVAQEALAGAAPDILSQTLEAGM